MSMSFKELNSDTPIEVVLKTMVDNFGEENGLSIYVQPTMDLGNLMMEFILVVQNNPLMSLKYSTLASNLKDTKIMINRVCDAPTMCIEYDNGHYDADETLPDYIKWIEERVYQSDDEDKQIEMASSIANWNSCTIIIDSLKEG